MSISRKNDEKESHFPDQKTIQENVEKIKGKPKACHVGKYYSYVCILRNEEKPIYLLYKNIPEAEGTTGEIYKAWLITPSEKEYKLEFRAMKLAPNFSKSEDFISKATQFLQEAKASQIIYPETQFLMRLGEQMFFLTRFISGNDLVNREGVLHPDILKLPLQARFNLIISICESVKELHQKGWMHGDISGRNIKFLIDKNIIKANLIDFGLAQEISVSSSSPTYHSPGTPGYLAPERVFEIQPTFKSDILSLTPLFALILGAVNPLEEKIKIRQDIQVKDLKKENLDDQEVDEEKRMKLLQRANEAEILVPYTYKGMLTEYSYFGNAIKAFLDRMQDRDPEKRPDISTVTTFFEKAREFDRIHSSQLQQGFFGYTRNYNQKLLLDIVRKAEVEKGDGFMNVLKEVCKKK